MPYTDRTLTCRDCGRTFLFSASEQDYFAAHGLRNTPRRCKDCRAASVSGSVAHTGMGDEVPSELHTVRCTLCGCTMRVHFVPHGVTSVTCSDCFHRAPTPEACPPRRHWTDDEILAALRALQAERGGYLQAGDLDRRQPLGAQPRPSLSAVEAHFGSWRQVCILLGQPYRLGNVKGVPLPWSRQWTDETILAALRELRERSGGRLCTRDLDLGRSGHKGRAGRYPTWVTVRTHFGSWDQMLARLDEPAGSPEAPERVHVEVGSSQ